MYCIYFYYNFFLWMLIFNQVSCLGCNFMTKDKAHVCSLHTCNGSNYVLFFFYLNHFYSNSIRQDGGYSRGTCLFLESRSSFCTSTSSFFKLPKDDWSLDVSLPSRFTLEWTNCASTFPWMLSPYVLLYLMKSVSITTVDRESFSINYMDIKQITWRKMHVKV